MSAGVLHVSTLKPFDDDAVIEAASQARAVLTLENHSIIGGLASAVCEALALARVSVRLDRIGVPDRFLECGSTDYLTINTASPCRALWRPPKGCSRPGNPRLAPNAMQSRSCPAKLLDQCRASPQEPRERLTAACHRRIELTRTRWRDSRNTSPNVDMPESSCIMEHRLFTIVTARYVSHAL